MSEEQSRKIVQLAEYRERKTGAAKCMSCGHEFAAVAPIEPSQWLACPSCGLEKALMVFPVERPEPHWECQCGSFLFYMTPDWAYCPFCGTRHSYGTV